MRMLSILVLSGSCAMTIGLSAQPTRSSVAPSKLRAILDLPVTPQRLVRALQTLAVRSRTPMGIEVVIGRNDGGAAPGQQSYDLSGLTLNQALDAIVRQQPEYTWSVEKGVTHVRPGRFVNNSLVALNREVATFGLAVTDLREALIRVHKIFDPGHRLPPASRARPEHVRSFLERPIAVAGSRVTVRAILDGIALQHGAMAWLAEYQDVSGGYPGLKLTFFGFDNWATSIEARLSVVAEKRDK